MGDEARWYDNTWSGTWSGRYRAQTEIPGGANYARAGVKVCEDQSLRPDDCSGMGWTYGNKH